MSYDLEFWKKRYQDKEEIKEWYKNFKSFMPPNKLSEDQLKEIFIEGEKNEIEEIFRNKNTREKLLNFMKEVIASV